MSEPMLAFHDVDVSLRRDPGVEAGFLEVNKGEPWR